MIAKGMNIGRNSGGNNLEDIFKLDLLFVYIRKYAEIP